MPLLDEGLPTFLFPDNKTGELTTSVYHTQGGSEPEPAYTFRRADPADPAVKNSYAIALFDAYNPEVVFGEVLLRPRWTQPTLSQDEIRKNGGVPPAPEPIQPTSFTIQLYDPDQQVVMTYKESTILGSARWDFGMPQDIFRTPSSSMLDQGMNDPGAAATTPKINFSWKKEKLGREVVCFYTGKSTDGLMKKRNKEPDVTCAVLKSLKRLTVYESNLSRVDLEDPKGLEVALLLSAAVIRDVYSGNLKQAFNIQDVPRRSSASQASSPRPVPTSPPIPQHHPLRMSHPNSPDPSRPIQTQGHTRKPSNTGAPPLDPHAQWMIDQETARLRNLAEAEAREAKQQEERRRRERERQANAESQRLRRLVEQEEQERRKREHEVEAETERLRQLYGVPTSQADVRPVSQPPPMPGAWPSSTPQGYGYAPVPPVTHPGYTRPPPQQPQQQAYYSGAPPPAQFSGSQFDASSGGLGVDRPPPNKPQRSFWDLRGQNKLNKKSSSAW